MPSRTITLGVLASGRGSNLQAMLDAIAEGRLAAKVAIVVSDRSDAQAPERARAAGIPAVTVSPRAFPTREEYDAQIAKILGDAGTEVIVLAGYMRIVTNVLLRAFPDRVINVHPSLLPAFRGLHAQRQAIDHGVKITGCTVHFVSEEVDSGAIILQAAVPVLGDDTEATLSERILAEEHRLLPQALQLYAEGRLTIQGRRVLITPNAHALH
jgi:phosphoribosylglycinamide formyltransferase-1